MTKGPYQIAFQILLVPAIISLDLLALRGWINLLRKTMPHWRNIACITSISSTFLSMIIFLAPMIAELAGSGASFPIEQWSAAMLILIAVGILSGCGLKGFPRFGVVLANLLLGILWRASMVF
jgi:hypothetical protein